MRTRKNQLPLLAAFKKCAAFIFMLFLGAAAKGQGADGTFPPDEKLWYADPRIWAYGSIAATLLFILILYRIFHKPAIEEKENDGTKTNFEP